MVWKSTGGECYSRPTYQAPEPRYVPQPRLQQGDIVVAAGRGKNSHVEQVYAIDKELCGYHLSSGKVLLRVPQNDTTMEQFIGLSFTKGVTERASGRTMLIIDNNAHHIEAMQHQFDGVLWSRQEESEAKHFGDTIRWINVGDTKNGFIGIDYNPRAPSDAGVARTASDIQFLSQTLLNYGYDEKKRIFLLRPPYINERPEGKALRRKGLSEIAQIAKANASHLAGLLKDQSYDIEITEVRR